jgi:circadian clock protein KaiC
MFGLQFLLAGATRGEPGLYVTLEEGPEQLLASADALGLPLRRVVDAGLVQILYVSRENIRAGQFLTVLADRLVALKASRVVLDAATQMLTEQIAFDELRHMLHKLVVRFKTLGITSVLTLESSSLYSTERATEQALSPIADNLLMLRYKEVEGRLAPTLTIVKTRGSDHDRGTHSLSVGRGGMRVGPPGNESPAPRARRPRGKKPSQNRRDRKGR